MLLSWNEIRARAAAFADEWQDAAYEKGETQSFYNDFFNVFGVRRQSVARYEEHVAKLDNRSGFIDLYWPRVLLVEQKSAGRDLKAAYEQAGEYFDALPERDRPRYILVSDFQTFELHDLSERRKIAFPLADMPAHVEAFGFILGRERRTFRDQDPANIEAAELVGRLHDALADVGYGGHDLERLLVRIVFCLFADDTGVFEPRDIFLDFVETRTRQDGSDLGALLMQVFQVLNTPEPDRLATLDEDLARFPYVNGSLFDGPLRIPAFDSDMRERLLDVCRFDWSKAGEYVKGSNARLGFVATNSITAGEQVAQLWPLLFERCKLEIAFAHRTFAWGSDARGKAHVHVVILGLDRQEAARPERRLFSYPDSNGEPEESAHAVLSPYLFDAAGLSDPHLVVREESAPINGMERLIIGSKPIDRGHYIFDTKERDAFLEAEPEAAPYVRPFMGAREYLHDRQRWILALHDASPDVLARLPRVRERIAAVRAYREASKSAPTRKLAATPTLYHVNVVPTAPFLVIPEVSSERREYAPIGWLEPPAIPSNKLRLLANATFIDFASLTSAMHMAWTRYIGGRLKSDYQYSVGINYNTFPPPPKAADLAKLEPLAQAVLDARAAHPGATLANLYDPDLMPPNLRRAHQALDRAVDRLYRRTGFASERERVEHLFMLYEKMRAPLDGAARIKPKRRRKSRFHGAA